MSELNEITLTIKNQLAVDVLMRAIDAELGSLFGVMGTCNREDSRECHIYDRAKEQSEELRVIKSELTLMNIFVRPTGKEINNKQEDVVTYLVDEVYAGVSFIEETEEYFVYSY